MNRPYKDTLRLPASASGGLHLFFGGSSDLPGYLRSLGDGF